MRGFPIASKPAATHYVATHMRAQVTRLGLRFQEDSLTEGFFAAGDLESAGFLCPTLPEHCRVPNVLFPTCQLGSM